MTAVVSGLDQLSFSGTAPKQLAGRRVGVLCHQASVNQNLQHITDIVRDLKLNLVAVFGPEHGVSGAAQDMIAVSDDTKSRGVPVYSLYGETFESLTPTDSMLRDVEVLLVDLQDVGTRYYTYIWTTMLCLQKCAALGISVVVLDRPNPLGGQVIEGPSIESGFESFVGLYPLPVRHGLTIGEICTLLRQELKIDVDLSVVKLVGWSRSMYFDQTGLPWVQPSPNMPTLDTALVYCGMCLLEGTNVSEGRGTTRPFEVFGAPWFDGKAVAASLRQLEPTGVRFRPLTFSPVAQKHAGATCGGVQLHVSDRHLFRSFATGVATILSLHDLHADSFRWRTEPYEFVEDTPAVDLLAGGAWLREACATSTSLDDLVAQWIPHETQFRQRRREFLLYDGE